MKKMLLLCVILLLSAFALAEDRNNNVPVANANFTQPALTLSTPNISVADNGIWLSGNVPDWTLLPDSDAGIWRPDAISFSENSQQLYINTGGVEQTLPVALASRTEYAVSAKWAYRFDNSLKGLAVQLLVGKEVLATCAPSSTQLPGTFSTVTLSYYSGHRGGAYGEPLTVRIVAVEATGNGVYGKFQQLDVTDVDVSLSPEREHAEVCSIRY